MKENGQWSRAFSQTEVNTICTTNKVTAEVLLIELLVDFGARASGEERPEFLPPPSHPAFFSSVIATSTTHLSQRL